MSFAKGVRSGGAAVVHLGQNGGASKNDNSVSAKSLIFGEEQEKGEYVAPGPGRVHPGSGPPMPSIRSAGNVNVPRERRGPSEMDLEAQRLRQEEGSKAFHDAKQMRQDVRSTQMRLRGLDGQDPAEGNGALLREPDQGPPATEDLHLEPQTRSNADLIATGFRRQYGAPPQVLRVPAPGGAAYPQDGEDEAGEAMYGLPGGLDSTLRLGGEEEELGGSLGATYAGSEALRKSVTISDEVQFSASPRGYDEGVMQQLPIPAPENVLKEKDTNSLRPEEESGAGPGAAALQVAAGAKPKQKEGQSLSGAWWPHEAKKKGPTGPVDPELEAILKAADEAAKEAKESAAAAAAFKEARAVRDQQKARAEAGGKFFGKAGSEDLQLSVSGARKKHVAKSTITIGAAGGGGRSAKEKAQAEENIGLSIFGEPQGTALKPRGQGQQSGDLELQAKIQMVDELALQLQHRSAPLTAEGKAFHEARAAREIQAMKNRGGSLSGGLFGKDPPQKPPARLTGENVITWT